jgi:phosphotransferase family enzyme
VLRYEISGRTAGDQPARRDVYGKVGNDNQGALIAPVISALQKHIAAIGGANQFSIPRSLGFRPDLHLALLEAIPGTPLINQLIKSRIDSAPATPGALTLEAAIDACAQVASTLHTSGITLGQRRTLDDDLIVLQRDIHMVTRIVPNLGTQFQSWLDRIATYAEESDALRLGFSHGDYTYTQLIFDGKQCGLVDFDTICQAEPALDLGQFLAYLRVATRKAHKRAAAPASDTGAQLGERFLQTYIATTGDRLEDVERLRIRVSVYTIISLLRMALHSWQQLKIARMENVISVLEEEMACLPQLDY